MVKLEILGSAAMLALIAAHELIDRILMPLTPSDLLPMHVALLLLTVLLCPLMSTPIMLLSPLRITQFAPLSVEPVCLCIRLSHTTILERAREGTSNSTWCEIHSAAGCRKIPILKNTPPKSVGMCLFAQGMIRGTVASHTWMIRGHDTHMYHHPLDETCLQQQRLFSEQALHNEACSCAIVPIIGGERGKGEAYLHTVPLTRLIGA